MNKPPFVDLHSLDEDDRIDMIGHRAIDHKDVVGFVVDDDGEKADRYIAKLMAKFPQIRVIARGKGPTEGAYFVKVGPPVE
jgi:hypothetical protein